LVAFLLVLPRLIWQAQHSGVFVLDLRLLSPLRIPIPASTNFFPLLSEFIGSDNTVVEIPTLAQRVEEALESALHIISPVTVLAIIIGLFLLVKYRLRVSKIQLLIGLFVLAQLLIVSPVSMNRRYFIALVPQIQLWGALALVMFAALCRRRFSAESESPSALRAGLIGSAVLLIALSSWSVTKTNVGSAHTELRDIAVWISQQAGPGQRTFTARPEVAYYSRGRQIFFSGQPSATLSIEQFRDLSREHSIDWLVLYANDDWASELFRLYWRTPPEPRHKRLFPLGLCGRYLLVDPTDL